MPPHPAPPPWPRPSTSPQNDPAWTRDNPGNFPPVCINITDGEPNDETAAENAARALMQTGTTDGTTLLFNAHIGNPADGEVKMPASEGHLSNQYARFLYRISSGVPQPLEAAARNVGFNVQSGSRGMLMNAGPEALTALIQFGSQHAR
ncbi:hypothetical protein [Verrucomicrobium spinosum]|uniref:hypothetical protein n=1 Tax=Verrucomicrobium spinosum TaxID=2736 RepID=UPI0009EAEE32|nr:hypothetical protein [Verrucomicrobium spinosum]